MLAYVLLLFSISSFDVFETMNWYQRFLIDNRNYPGGPMAYYAAFSADKRGTAGRVWYAYSLMRYDAIRADSRRLAVLSQSTGLQMGYSSTGYS